jgi:AcrR family transcriptional regulator
MSDQRRASPDRGAPARGRLIDATVDIIRRKGLGAATSRAIVDGAGENLGSITYYFGSKDALVAEALTSAARTLVGPVIDTLGDEGPAIERLLRAVPMLYAALADHRGQLPVYTASLAASTANPAVGSELRSLHRELASSLATTITGLRADGSIPSWVDPEPMAELIVALVDGVVVGSALDPDLDAIAIGQQFAALLVAVAGQSLT